VIRRQTTAITFFRQNPEGAVERQIKVLAPDCSTRPDKFMVNFYASSVKQIFGVPERQSEQLMHHHAPCRGSQAKFQSA